MHSRKGNRLFHMVLIALMTAVMSVLSPFSIPLPFSPVPLSLTTFVLYLSLYITGPKYTFISCLLYLLLGLIGMPVFSGFSGGPGKLLGPTGGYLIGYLFIPLITALFPLTKNIFKLTFRVRLIHGFTLVLGTFCCYLVGTFWLAYQTDISCTGAFLSGVLPFIPGDICKIALALLLGPFIRLRLQKAHVL